LGSDLEQIATIACGLVVIDFGVAISIAERFCASSAIGRPSRAEIRLPYLKRFD
jgi:hypothetical protein